MNNFMIGLKRFFTNKNVVTILLVLVILGALYYGYTSSINKQTNPIEIPVAVDTIGPQTKITNEMLVIKKIPGSMVDETVIKSFQNIVGKYTNINVTVPQGSVFYESWLADAQDIPGTWLELLDSKKGELGYYMNVDVENTFGNSIIPNSYIDIYMEAKDENGTIMYGKLMKDIKVLVVHDAGGKNAFGTEVVQASKIGFAVNQDLLMLLRRAKYLGIDLDIQPRGTKVENAKGITVASSTLRDYIDAKTLNIPDDVINEVVEEKEAEEANQDEQNTKVE